MNILPQRPLQAPHLLIIGTGDVAWRALPWLLRRFRVFALCRSAESVLRWRAAGAVPIQGDLDHPATLRRLAGLAPYVVHAAPPAQDRTGDPRTRRLLATLQQGRMLPRRLVYISTTGVYGDCCGARIPESHPRRPGNARALRRLAAEQGLRRQCLGYRPDQRRPLSRGVPGRDRLSSWNATRDRVAATGHGQARRPGRRGTSLVILRAPGIYAADRLPLARLRAGTPALLAAEDGYTSHIHAEDLATSVCLACFRSGGGRAFHVCDDTELRMGDWFDLVADHFHLSRPSRISRSQAEQTLPPALLSFMRESRRLENRRLKTELRMQLRYRTVQDGLAAIEPTVQAGLAAINDGR